MTASLLDQLQAASACAQEIATRAPRLARPMLSGIQPSRTTERVLLALYKAHPRPMTHGELKRACHAQRGAISWALRYLALAGQPHIEASETGRAYYLRYRLTAHGLEEAQKRGGK